jgi:hypothetical protein
MKGQYPVGNHHVNTYLFGWDTLCRALTEAAGKVLLAGFCLAALCSRADKTNEMASTNIQGRVQLAIDNSERIFRHDFDVAVASEQMNTLIEEKITEGSPLPVEINQLMLAYRNGEGNFKASIQGLPPEFREQVEPKLNEKMKQIGLGSFWDKTTKSFLSLAKEEIAKGGQVNLVKESDKQLVVAIEKLDRPFHKDARLNAIRLIIDKKNMLVAGARLYLAEAKDLTVMMEYQFLKVEGEETPLPVWSSIQIEQNSWMGTLFGFIGWPNKMLVSYSDYTFHKSAQ